MSAVDRNRLQFHQRVARIKAGRQWTEEDVDRVFPKSWHHDQISEARRARQVELRPRGLVTMGVMGIASLLRGGR
ncbi:MAG: hypothetical protein D6688_10825 [Alphaproteobacteria bacterium]|nr:MAG: hypothetical protein D6688_10825 [Alphaproteobacteria bacterium]